MCPFVPRDGTVSGISGQLLWATGLFDGDSPVRSVIFIESSLKAAFESIASGHACWHVGCFLGASGSQLAIMNAW